MYFVYIIKSLKFNRTYTGITDSIPRRLKQHNEGFSFYTKRFRPWELIYQEEVVNRSEARIREKYLKSCAGRKWIKKFIFNDKI